MQHAATSEIAEKAETPAMRGTFFDTSAQVVFRGGDGGDGLGGSGGGGDGDGGGGGGGLGGSGGGWGGLGDGSGGGYVTGANVDIAQTRKKRPTCQRDRGTNV